MNLGLCQSDLGMLDEAAANLSKALASYREIAEASPQYSFVLAAALLNLGGIDSKLGLKEAALRSALEAAEIYRRLAAENQRPRPRAWPSA